MHTKTINRILLDMYLIGYALTSCNNSSITSTPKNEIANTITPTSVSTLTYPGPTLTTENLTPTPTLYPIIEYLQNETPYYERTYRLPGACDEGQCLFYDNQSNPSYPIGYATLYGYYVPVDRITRRIGSTGAEKESCDGFVIIHGAPDLLKAYESTFFGDDAVLSKIPDGNLVINIPLYNQDEATKEIIYSSTSDHPVRLSVINLPPIYRGIAPCFSPVHIISAYKPISRSELSNTYLIAEADNGKTFTYNVTTRFMVTLDDKKHPKSKLTCEPEPIFGWISNGSNPDPERYPEQFEIARTGKCILTNGDFQVTIIGVPLE